MIKRLSSITGRSPAADTKLASLSSCQPYLSLCAGKIQRLWRAKHLSWEKGDFSIKHLGKSCPIKAEQNIPQREGAYIKTHDRFLKTFARFDFWTCTRWKAKELSTKSLKGIIFWAKERNQKPRSTVHKKQGLARRETNPKIAIQP